MIGPSTCSVEQREEIGTTEEERSGEILNAGSDVCVENLNEGTRICNHSGQFWDEGDRTLNMLRRAERGDRQPRRRKK